MPTLSEVLRAKLIPWSQQDAAERFIVAHPEMRQMDMPYDVQLAPHKIQSQRFVVKNRRNYGNVRNLIARWPEEGLLELNKYVLVCVLDGHVNYQLGDYKVRCGPGHFIFIPPGIPHPNGAIPYIDKEKCTSCDVITFLLHPGALEYWMNHDDDHAQRSEQYNACLISHDSGSSARPGRSPMKCAHSHGSAKNS